MTDTTDRRTELPTQSTGQLLWLVVAVVIAGLPHYPYMTPWVPALVLTIAGWRVAMALRRWRLPGSWVRGPLTILAFTAILVSYRQISGLDAGSALLLVMVSMKLLETRGHRDRAVVVFICYFLLFAAFLREQAIWSAAYLLAGVVVTTACLFQIARRGSVMSAGRALSMAGSLVLQAVPLMILLFVLFPRVPGPFWSLPQQSGSGITGLADEMSPGDITRLALSREVAFRVTFDAEPPAESAMYWRGPVMNRFDGRTWKKYSARPLIRTATTPDAPLLDYRITLEPHNQHWLLALESPVSWDHPRAVLTSAHQLVTMLPIEHRVAYRAQSTLAPRMTDQENHAILTAARALPGAANPKTTALAERRRAQARDDREYLNGLLRMFRTELFFYSLEPPPLADAPVDEFLFESRTGFCGHYASAFAVLARAAGIPARVVTGYHGGEFNPLGNYWIVRQSNAHAWTEVWLDGDWVRFDPTAAIAPERVDIRLADVPDRGDFATAARFDIGSWVNRLELGWDAANATWNSWVLAYGPDSQTALMNAAGIDSPSSRHLIIAMVVSVAGFLIVLTLLHQVRSRPHRDLADRAYIRLCARLGRASRPRRPAEGPTEYAAAVGALRPDLAAAIGAIFDAYIGLRYGGNDSETTRRHFAAQVSAFRPRRRRTEPAGKSGA